MSCRKKPATIIVKNGKVLGDGSNSGISDKGHNDDHSNKNDRHTLIHFSGPH
jgi:hypothetical protein